MPDQTKAAGTAGYIRSLSSFERKLIHEFITANYPDLTTSSVGEGRERQLVIEAKKIIRIPRIKKYEYSKLC